MHMMGLEIDIGSGAALVVSLLLPLLFMVGIVRQLTNLDAGESEFFSRELEAIKAQTYDVMYPELKARRLIPVSMDAGPGAESITYRQYDHVGLAKLIASYADDLPRADVFGKEFTTPVRSIGDSYGYSLQEIRAAAMSGRPLAQRKANAARRAVEELIDRLAATGDTASGLAGFVNNANVTANNVANGAAASPLWANKTPTEIGKDLNTVIKDLVDTSKGLEMGPFRVLLPLEQYTLIAQTRNSDASDVTILQFILQSNPFVAAIEPWWRLKGAGAGGTDRGIVYTPNPDKLTLEIPLDFEQLDVQERGLEFVVPCHARYGGVIVYYPLSMQYFDGI